MTFTDPGLQRVQEVTYGDSSVFTRCVPMVDGVLVTPSGTSTFAVYAPRGDTVLASGNCTTDGTRLRATFNASSSSSYPLDRGFRCVFTIVSNSITYRRVVLFDVVRVPLLDACPINLNHLKGFNVEVDAFLDQQIGTDAAAIAEATGLIITPAWERVLSFVESSGYRPALVSTPDVLVPLARAAGYQQVSVYMMRTPTDMRVLLLERADKAWEAAVKYTKLIYNTTDNNDQQEVRAWAQPRVFTGRDPVRDGLPGLNWKRPGDA